MVTSPYYLKYRDDENSMIVVSEEQELDLAFSTVGKGLEKESVFLVGSDLSLVGLIYMEVGSASTDPSLEGAATQMMKNIQKVK
jgi:hypothetical protein